jgi:hypothetical protein
MISSLFCRIKQCWSGLTGKFQKKVPPPAPKVEEERVAAAKMTNNRLAALDGQGYRQCYMDKLREVASGAEANEANKEYWFGADEMSQAKEGASVQKRSSDRHAVLKASRITNTRLQALAQSMSDRERADRSGVDEEE